MKRRSFDTPGAEKTKNHGQLAFGSCHNSPVHGQLQVSLPLFVCRRDFGSGSVALMPVTPAQKDPPESKVRVVVQMLGVLCSLPLLLPGRPPPS